MFLFLEKSVYFSVNLILHFFKLFPVFFRVQLPAQLAEPPFIFKSFQLMFNIFLEHKILTKSSTLSRYFSKQYHSFLQSLSKNYYSQCCTRKEIYKCDQFGSYSNLDLKENFHQFKTFLKQRSLDFHQEAPIVRIKVKYYLTSFQ